jgi:hypothetical protein
MLKPLEDILKPDRRHVPGGPMEAVTDVRLEDLHADMVPLQLHSSVPEEVRWQYDTARHAFVYSWFCYDLVTLAEQQAYGALENGLRLRARAAQVQPKGNSLKVLMACACDNGWLQKSDFEAPGMPNRLDLVRVARNHVSHGQLQLLLRFSLEMIHLCAEILNKLFPEKAKS